MASEHRLIIGRDPSCDVVINDPYASPRHAALIWVRDPGVVQVMDLGSTNGVWLNRDRVWGRRLITFTDTLLVGRTQVDVGLLLLKLAYARGIAEGLRQATEGWEREWGTRYPEGDILKPLPEADARLYAGRYAGSVVSRLVGPWEPAEQPEPAEEDVRAAIAAEPEPDPLAEQFQREILGMWPPDVEPGCPNDTDGDGNCGRRLCPHCGEALDLYPPTERRDR